MAETLEAVHTSRNAEKLAYRSSQAVQFGTLGGVFVWETRQSGADGCSCPAISQLRHALALLGCSFDLAHGQIGTRQEAHGFVQPARARIAFADVQKGRDAAPAVAGEERAREPACMASSGMAGMRANAAYFLQPGERHAFAGHGDQYAALVDAQVQAELGRAFAEEIGKGDARELAHGGPVIAAEDGA